MHILHVIGARPNFMKAAPVIRALEETGQVEQSLVHTGQHYDTNMSDVFFRQLEIPAPDFNLGVGSGTHARQTAEVMIRLEEILLDRRPDTVLVYGDVNSTVAAALVSSKLMIQLGHVEAGLRSRDKNMPEEINRMVTDRLSDLLFTPSEDGDLNLIHEGTAPESIHRVGNVMIDTLVRLLPVAKKTDIPWLPEKYALVTLHRPSNVDDPDRLQQILESLLTISAHLHVVFPVHPRTRQRLPSLSTHAPNLHLTDPLPYIEFLELQRRATVVITDSGGIQEETTYLGVPCLTLRENTERPITVDIGTNILIGNDLTALRRELGRILDGHGKSGTIPPFWDGHAGTRIAKILCQLPVTA